MCIFALDAMKRKHSVGKQSMFPRKMKKLKKAVLTIGEPSKGKKTRDDKEPT